MSDISVVDYSIAGLTNQTLAFGLTGRIIPPRKAFEELIGIQIVR